MRRRGVTEDEVLQVLTTGTLGHMREGRQIKVSVFTAGYRWRGNAYPHKEVQVVHLIDQGEIIVVTVISRYGHWEGTS